MSYFHGLFAGTIEGLEQCPNTQSLDLSRNCLEDVENFEHCKNLWRLNLSDNKVCTIFKNVLKFRLFFNKFNIFAAQLCQKPVQDVCYWNIGFVLQ